MIDFRSDTVTMPDEAMRDVMATAEVGDDVYGEDPLASRLETQIADLLGKEAGLFVSSGTQSNLIAMLTHASRGEEVLSGAQYHSLYYEAGGIAALGGVIPCPLPVNSDGSLNASDVEQAVKQDDYHYPVSRLLSLENTHNGLVQQKQTLQALCELAHEKGLSTHLDGARLMNAVIATNVSAADYAQSFDSVSLCLSKGLGAPVGSVLVGSASFISRARRLRKMLGGGMRQVGMMAAAGLYAIDHNVSRLKDDHIRAKTLAQGLNDISGIHVDMDSVQTNMVYMQVPEAMKSTLPERLMAGNIRISPAKKMFRLVVHKDIDDDGISAMLHQLASIMATA